MNDVNEAWWAFAWELVGHYYDGMVIHEDGSSENLGYPTEWLVEVGFGQTSLDDIAKLNGETPAEETAPAATEAAPAATTAPVEAETQAPEVNTTSSNSTALTIGIVIAVIVAAAAFFFLKKKKQ